MYEENIYPLLRESKITLIFYISFYFSGEGGLL